MTDRRTVSITAEANSEWTTGRRHARSDKENERG
jgi:hypothetical protein